MKIELIGTGSIFSESNSACTLINDKVLVDIPNGACKGLLKLGHNLQDIDCCIITHLHGDHYFDLPFLLLSQLKNLNRRETAFTIVGEKGIEKVVKDLVELAFKGNYDQMVENLHLRYIECEELKEFELFPQMKISSYAVEHSEKYNSFGYLLVNDGLSVGFTGDAKICDGVYELLEKSDILVADMSNEVGDDSHMGIDNILTLSNNRPSKTIVATHMKDTTRVAAEKINSKNIIIPSDGFAIELKKVVK
ncbi:MAG: ribonuclease Z [Clostridia bacterium]|nr:ribonuclease Z [Clostridia bacterium]